MLGFIKKYKLILFLVSVLTIGLIISVSVIIPRGQSNVIIKTIRAGNREEIIRLINNSNKRILNSISGYWFEQWLYEKLPTTPMVIACYYSDYETVKLLFEKGASVNYIKGAQSSPLKSTLSINDINSKLVLDFLLENGADVNFSNKNINPALLYVCDTSILDDFRILIDLNGQFRNISKKSQEEEVLELIKLLIDYDADVYAEDYSGDNAIYYLAKNNNVLCFQYMMENYDFDVNKQNKFSGGTPLMSSIRMVGKINFEVTELLLSYGADKTIKDNNGKTAYDYAVERGYMEIAELLKN